MTVEELTEFRAAVTTKLAEEGIKYYRGPYAVISSPFRNNSDDGGVGRRYRGFSSILRIALFFITSLQDLTRGRLFILPETESI